MITVAHCIEIISDLTGVTIAEIKGQQRSRKITAARHMAIFLAKRTTEHSLPQIGRSFGGRDHTTVLYGVRKAQREIAKDNQLGELFARAEKKLRECVINQSDIRSKVRASWREGAHPGRIMASVGCSLEDVYAAVRG